nr:hypothetical protein [Tanacetum cinerariifolium]
MEELLQAPTEGYREAIVIPKINADHFEINTNLLQLVQANPYHGFERENPHTHINNFKGITLTLKFKDVPNDMIKLMMFPYSLEGTARVWYDKEPPNSILTWEDLVNKFVNQFFPPSKTTHLKNEISRFTQRFEETYGEAWERFKEMLRACPHHGFTELTQIDTFYNGLNENDQDSLNATAGRNLLIPNNQVQQGFSNEFLSYKKANDQMMRNMQSQINSSKGEFKNEIQNAMKTQQTVLMEQQNTFENNLQNMLSGFLQNQASTSGTLPSNTIPNPKGEMKEITTRSGVAYEGPLIPTKPFPKKVVERETDETTDKEQTNFQGSTAHIQPLVIPILKDKLFELAKTPLNENCSAIPLKKLPEKLRDLGKFLIPFVTIRSGLAYEGPLIPTNSSFEKVVERNAEEITDQEHSNCQGSTAHIQPLKLREKAMNQMEKFFQIFHDLHFNISFADALLVMPKFASIFKSLLTNKDKLFELAIVSLNENCSTMLLKKLLEKLGDPDKFLTPCDFPGIDVCHALADLDRSIARPKGVAKDVFVKVGKLHFPTDFVVVDFEADPRVPLILGRSFLRTGHALIDVYEEEITLRVNDEPVTFNLNKTMRYSSTYDDNSVNRVDVIDIACEEFVQDVLDF